MAGRGSGALLNRSQPPSGSPARDSRFPEIDAAVAGNGLRVLLVRRSDVPLITMRLLDRAGGQHDPEDQPGLASFTGAILDEGTKLRSSVEIADQIEGLGGYLSSGADWDGCSVSVGGLVKHLDFALDLMLETFVEPAFDTDEVERQRALRLGELQRMLADPATLASRAFVRAVYGDHPYGHNLVGLPDSLAGISGDACRRFWFRHLAPDSCAAVFVGDVPNALDAAALAERLSSLPEHHGPSTPDLEIASAAHPGIHLVDLPQASQTELRVGHVGIARTDPDRATVTLLNSILGGKFTSRINLNLRERHGFTYGANSRFVARRGPGPFLVSAAVETASAQRSIEEIVHELRRLCDEPVAEEELEDARNYVLGVFPYTLQTVQGVAGRLEEIALYDLPLDTFDRYREQLREVTREDLSRVARERLDPDRLVIAAVGPAAELASSLAALEDAHGPLERHPPSL